MSSTRLIPRLGDEAVNFSRWIDIWLPSLEGGLELQEVTPEDRFAFLVRDIGLPRHRALGNFFRDKKVLVLVPPMMLRMAEQEFFAGGATARARSIYKASKSRPDRFTTDIDAVVIDCVFSDKTVLFLGLQKLVEEFDGPVVTMGHFRLDSLSKPPKETNTALKLLGKPPAKVVWFPPLNPQLLRDAFGGGRFSAEVARIIGTGRSGG